MKDELLKKLTDEVRRDFNIPFFYTDESLKNDVLEGNAYLKEFVGEIDYTVDLVAKMLLKNYAFYSYNKRVDDFRENYSDAIFDWQFSKIKAVHDDETDEE